LGGGKVEMRAMRLYGIGKIKREKDKLPIRRSAFPGELARNIPHLCRRQRHPLQRGNLKY